MKIFEILLVEDNYSDAELAIRVLRKVNANSHITHLADGPSVLDYLLPKNPKDALPKYPGLILLDLKIPKVNGLEVLKILKENSLTKSIPVVMLTSSQHEQDVDMAYEFGVNSFIVKPVEFDKYSEIISKVGDYWISVNHD